MAETFDFVVSVSIMSLALFVPLSVAGQAVRDWWRERRRPIEVGDRVTLTAVAAHHAGLDRVEHIFTEREPRELVRSEVWEVIDIESCAAGEKLLVYGCVNGISTTVAVARQEVRRQKS